LQKEQRLENEANMLKQREHAQQERDQQEQERGQREQEQREREHREQSEREQNFQSPVKKEIYEAQTSRNPRNKIKGQYTTREHAFFEVIQCRKLQTKIPPEMVLKALKQKRLYSETALEEWITDDTPGAKNKLTAALLAINIKTIKCYRKSHGNDQADALRKEQQRSEALENSRQSLLPQTGNTKRASSSATVAVPVPFSSTDDYSRRPVVTEPLRQDYDADFGSCICCCLAPLFAPKTDQRLATTSHRY